MKKKRKHIVMVALAALGIAGSLTAQFAYQGSRIPKIDAEVVTDNSSTENFISSIATTAQTIANQYDLYPSVMIAQAVLESHSGTSTLSQAPYYNFFGIKGEYNGSSVTLPTWEDDGAGNVSTIDAAFRSYPSVADSLYDYATLLSSDYYAGTHRSNTTAYTDATAALTGTYATDTSYADKLNSIIATYGLTQYDAASLDTTVYADVASGTVWNSYRGAYTDAETLAADQAWANQ